MAMNRVKTSAYLGENLYERTKIYSEVTALPFNTHIVLALEEYLKKEDRQAAVRAELERRTSKRDPKS